MYRILPKKLIFLAFAWLVIGLIALSDALLGVAKLQLRITAIPGLAWLLLSGLLCTPVWRFVWRKYPKLNRLFFPDLNGEWIVELRSNWPRQLQLLQAAASTEMKIDMRTCPEGELAPLVPTKLRAEITQTWWSFEMRLWNPQGDSPIERSDTISVDPIPRKGQRPPGICYFYKQINATDNVSDDAEFYGAARLAYDSNNDQLTGTVWTARMWRRAMNTAASATFIRA